MDPKLLKKNHMNSTKKIISFSLWGDNPMFTKGAIENAKLAPKIYPGWIPRFYVHNLVSYEVVSELESLGAETVIMDLNIKVEDYNKQEVNLGWFWRFEALKDPDVERFIVRDTDSRLNLRERNCVKDWERSGKSVHIIRDHPHHGVRMLAGTWGATRAFAETVNYPELIKDFADKHPTNNGVHGGYDQFFLSTVIYPLAKKSLCVHDSHPQRRYVDEAVTLRPFPALSLNYPVNDFIGKPFEL